MGPHVSISSPWFRVTYQQTSADSLNTFLENYIGLALSPWTCLGGFLIWVGMPLCGCVGLARGWLNFVLLFVSVNCHRLQLNLVVEYQFHSCVLPAISSGLIFLCWGSGLMQWHYRPTAWSTTLSRGAGSLGNVCVLCARGAAVEQALRLVAQVLRTVMQWIGSPILTC